ncbi:MAG TPA: CPBP family intramembrane glutamic endopeptidase [Candidatus Acidoferrum sp.]|nr:CPBP family intramembrane glutamic endopeptidase [Candidatus Acidoferrum sp.]
MAGDRLTSSEKRALLLWVAAGIIGLLFAHKYFFQAFPEASVNFQVSREEALSRARKFVSGLGENLTGYKSSIIFAVDEDAKVYLERQLGLREANRLMSSELNIWYWEVRFFKPLQEEEFEVRVSPSGQIVDYDHKIEEARAGASLERAPAQSAAQDFLSARLGMDLRGWDALPEEANSKKKPNRTDWMFTWEKHGFRAKDAPYRLKVTVQGDHVGGSDEFLKVPEAWQRGYRRMRSGNDTLASVFFVLYFGLLAVAIWQGIKLTLQGKTRWRGAILLGLVVAALLFLQNLNYWPQWSAEYDTNDPYSTFIAGKLAFALLFALTSALTVTLVLPAGEPLYRESQPERLRLSRAFRLSGLRTKEFFSAAVVGVSLAAAHIGYVVAFYVVAGHFGAWAPQELNFDNSVNTAFPWISGAAIGLLASTNEEFTFRLFAIPFFAKFTRSRWLAVIAPAFLWSFLHSNYPQEPAYIRGIEIGVVGVIAGLVMLRWGIVATLIWHYTVDASLVGLLLVRSNSLYFKISGVVVAAAALAPLALACISYLTRGGFETNEESLNRAAPLLDVGKAGEPIGETAETTSPRYDALTPAMLGFLSVCLVAGCVLVGRLKPETIGDYLKLSTDSRSARSIADQTMRHRGLDPGSYYHATVFADIGDPVSNEFLRQRLGTARVNAIYAQQVPAALWRVRYFRDSQPEEFAIIVRPDGTLHSVRHALAEEAPAASLTKEEAVAHAQKFLTDEKKVDLKDWELVESASDKKPHRTDHTLSWQQKAALDSSATGAPADHAYARIELQVLGDEVTNYRTYIKIPDAWRREHAERSLARALVSFGVPTLFFVGLGLTTLILFLKNLKSEASTSIPWKRILLWSLWGFAAYVLILGLGDRLPNFLNAYDTAIPMKLFFGGLAIGALLGGPLYLGAIALLFGAAWYFAVKAFGKHRLPGWLGMPAAYYRDALFIGLGGSAGLLGLERLLAAASTHWPTAHRYLDVVFGQDYDALYPAAAVFGGTLLRGLLLTGLVAVIASFIAAHVRQTGLRLLLFFLGALSLVGGSYGTPADFAKQFLARLILLGVLVLGVRYIMRFNLLGCFLIVAGTSLVSGSAELLAQPDAFYRNNGYAVLLMLALLFAWPLAAWRFSSMKVAGPSAASMGNT